MGFSNENANFKEMIFRTFRTFAIMHMEMIHDFMESGQFLLFTLCKTNKHYSFV